MMPQRKGVILFGHGSRDPLWRQPIEAVAARLRSREPGLPVLCAYLELEQPDLATAVERLAGEGVVEITIVPMFLGTGKHAREDLPPLVRQLSGKYPSVRLTLRRAVGEDSRVLDLLASIALE